ASLAAGSEFFGAQPGHFVDIGAGGKCPVPRAGQDHGLDAVVRFVLGQGLVEFPHQRKAQGVQLVRAIERDHGNRIETLRQNALISHCSPSCAAPRLFDTSGGQVFTQPLRRFWRREMVGSLEGVRVLELARYQAGPRGGMILSDLGAEVIKIEKLGGEETRRSEPLVRGQSVYFSVYN